MATTAKELALAGKKRSFREGDGRRNNRGVVGHRGAGGRPEWLPERQRKPVDGAMPGTFREETLEEAWARTREEVSHYVAIGYPQEHIIRLVKPTLTENTLRKYFTYELENGHLARNAKMAGTIYYLGVSGRDPAMARFWVRSRMGWRDTGPVPSGGTEVKFMPIDGDDFGPAPGGE